VSTLKKDHLHDGYPRMSSVFYLLQVPVWNYDHNISTMLQLFSRDCYRFLFTKTVKR